MTREEFIMEWAANSNVSAAYAKLGFVDLGHGTIKVALPCACGESDCEGWAICSPEMVSHQLEFNAPEELRAAYCKAIA